MTARVTAPEKERGGARFRWHPQARLFDGQGRAQPPLASGPSVIADRPACLALAQALAAGLFRIGGPAEPPIGGPQPMFETLTAGSSGVPRRIRRSHASWIASFAQNAALFGIGPGVAVAVLGRLVHSLALYGAVEALHLGATLHLLDRLRPDRQRLALAARGVAVLYATPAQLWLLIAAGGPELPALRVVLIGGSMLDAGLRLALAGLAPRAGLHGFYGAAEASFISLSGPDCPPDSAGRAYPGVEIQVRHGDDRLPEGQLGAIWARSPYLFCSYAGAAAGGASAGGAAAGGAAAGGAEWRDGWLTVGEIGRLAGGFLYLAGRAGRMVTVADQNVFPEEIEAFIAGLPGVDRVAVIPQPDPLRGVVLLAVVQGDPAGEAGLLAAARQRFGALKAPRAVVWRHDWPALASGKTDLAAIARGVGEMFKARK